MIHEETVSLKWTTLGGWNEPALHLLNEPPWGWFYLSVSQHIRRWKNSTFNKKQIHCGMLVRCVPACEGHVKNGRHHSSQSAECTKSFYPWTFNQCFRGLLRWKDRPTHLTELLFSPLFCLLQWSQINLFACIDMKSVPEIPLSSNEGRNRQDYLPLWDPFAFRLITLRKHLCTL